MHNDLIYQLALTRVPQLGIISARTLLQYFGSAEGVFQAGRYTLEKIEGIGPVRAAHIKQFKDFNRAEKEIHFVEKFGIRPLFLSDPDYPQRLLHCADAPLLLFYKGSSPLNVPRIIAIIGTRSLTDYGKRTTEQFIRGIAGSGPTIVSGLAFGIDALAHRGSLRSNLPTVAVVAHGLSHVYPPEHSSLARDILTAGGGILTEHWSDEEAEKHHFPVRNRVVAGMTDATIVIETGIRGGSMITARLANDYNRDVFAFPGRINDEMSEGCNYLVRDNLAILLQSPQQFLEQMGWSENVKQKVNPQTSMFHNLEPVERIIFDLLNMKKELHVDELLPLSGLSSSQLASTLLNLELKNLVRVKPGKIYQVV